MDIWGVGCVMFEILALVPLFPGKNELDQVDKIHNIVGTPPAELLNRFRAKASHMDFNFPYKEGTGFDSLLTHVSKECKEVIQWMLIYNPDDRPTARQVLKHPYFAEHKSLEAVKSGGSRKAGSEESNTNTNSGEVESVRRKGNVGPNSHKAEGSVASGPSSKMGATYSPQAYMGSHSKHNSGGHATLPQSNIASNNKNQGFPQLGLKPLLHANNNAGAASNNVNPSSLVLASSPSEETKSTLGLKHHHGSSLNAHTHTKHHQQSTQGITEIGQDIGGSHNNQNNSSERESHLPPIRAPLQKYNPAAAYRGQAMNSLNPGLKKTGGVPYGKYYGSPSGPGSKMGSSQFGGSGTGMGKTSNFQNYLNLKQQTFLQHPYKSGGSINKSNSPYQQKFYFPGKNIQKLL